MREEKKSTPVPLAPWKFVVLIVAGVLLSVCASAEETAFPSPKDAIPQSELSSDYAEPIISIDEALNPASSMDGAYPVKSSGMYGGGVWMDNHRVIFSGVDDGVKNDNQNVGRRVIKIWDVDTGHIHQYKVGGLNCYANGLITISHSVIDGTPPRIRSVYSHGKFGAEMETKEEFPPDCYQRKTEFVRTHLESHPEDLIGLLMPEHGFFVWAKRDFYPGESRTKNVYYSNKIVLHAPGNESLEIPAAGLKLRGGTVYYPFANAYLLSAKESPAEGIYLLSSNGRLFSQKNPATYRKNISGVYLTRRGVLWVTNDIYGDDPGMYLSRGDQIKKISSDSLRSGVVSPDGCRLLYTHRLREGRGFLGSSGFDLTGRAGFEGILKVIDLCKGDK